MLTVEFESCFPLFRALVNVEGIFPLLRRGDVLVEFDSGFRRCDDESRSGIHDHWGTSVRDLAIDSDVSFDSPVSELSNGRIVDLSFVPRRIRSTEIKFTFVRITEFERVKVSIYKALSLKRLKQGVLARVADRRESHSYDSVDISIVELRRNGRSGSDVSILDFQSSDIDSILEQRSID